MSIHDLRALLIEAGAIFDDIDDLPMSDDGSRDLPVGMLDRAREIMRVATELEQREGE